MNRELRRLIFKDILPAEALDKIGNLNNIEDDDILQDESGDESQPFTKESTRRPRSHSITEEQKAPQAQKRRLSQSSQQDGEEDQDEGDSDDKNSFQDILDQDKDSQNDQEEREGLMKRRNERSDQSFDPDTEGNDMAQTSQIVTPSKDTPYYRPTGFPERRVQFQSYQGIDLTMLYATKSEVVYKLTEIYLPSNPNQRQKMIEYNKDKMVNQNEFEKDTMRAKKRTIKEELKQAKYKLKHQLKYCNPAPLLDDAFYFYTSGMTVKQLDQNKERGKYANAHHIAKVIPQKRQITQALIDHNKQQQMEALRQSKKEEESKLKSYLLEDKYSLGSLMIIKDEDLKISEISTDENTRNFKEIESEYKRICELISITGKSLSEFSNEERETVKQYLKIQANNFVAAKYPTINLNPIEKHCFSFMKHLNQHDFSYKGQKSALQSDDTGMFFEDFIGGGVVGGGNHSTGGHGSQAHPIFGLTSNNTNANTDDRMSVISDERPNANPKNEQQISDHQLQEWFIEQKYKIMESNTNQKRKKYWGEPTDCSSLMQLKKDNYLFKKHELDLQRKKGGKREERAFRIEREIAQNPNQKHKRVQFDEEKKSIEFQQPTHRQIKDIKEYEYFKKQQSYFYQEGESKITVNSIMRGIQFELGMITEEEFYQQEALEDQISDSRPNESKSNQRDRLHEIELRKEKACNEVSDNFDFHFEKRKKELHDVIMKKIQMQEKANQQTSANQQTIAYASSSHKFLQAQSDSQKPDSRDKIKNLVNIKMNNGDEFGGGGHGSNGGHMGNGVNDGLGDDDINMDEANMMQHKNQQMHEGMAEDNIGKRVTSSRANELNHAKCILKLTYTKFDWSEKALLNFHRPNIHDEFEILEDQILERMRMSSQSKSSFVIQNGQFKIQDRIDTSSVLRQEVSRVNVKVMNTEYIDRRAKKIGIINAHDYFKDRFKLSLKDGKFCIFEHADQHPLFINNFGMASKLKRYIYSEKPLQPSSFIKKQENNQTKHMGPHGAQVLKKKGEKIPLLGQIDTKYIKGLTVLENNMYYCPVFYHKPQRSDFLCVFHKDKNGKRSIIVRELSEMYVMGQEEPKIEVYNPQSRTYQHFIKRRTQAYVIRFLQENNNLISFMELNKYFPYINDQILKKIIKEINVEVDRNQMCYYNQEFNDQQFNSLITPENLCQYESAQFGEQMLKKVGIKDISNADKISYATNKFCSEEHDPKKQLIARIIEEEVLSTPWNLSQNFIHNRQQRGMMMLEGIGDPSNGHGGYSYLKLPLKISQDSLNKAKINRMYLNPAIQNPKAVTGTDADLRKLSKKEIKNKLIDLGFKEDNIGGLTRWEMVALLRERSSQAVSQGIEGDMKKFARGVRFTSKKQREMYQKQVNDIFKKQINYLSREAGDFISDVSDSESRDQRQKKINDMQQTSSNYSKNIIEITEDIPIKNIQDIPGYEILVINQQPQATQAAQPSTGLNIGSNSGGGAVGNLAGTGYDPSTGLMDKQAAKEALKQRLSEGLTFKCTILRKKIKNVSSNSGEKEKIERVIFCSDLRQIKGFQKRKHKHEVKIKRTKKTSLKEKMQVSKQPLNDDKERRSETSSIVAGGGAIRMGAPNMSMQNQVGNTMGSSGGEPVKIKIGDSGMGSSGIQINTGGLNRSSTQQTHHEYVSQKSSIIPQSANLSALSKQSSQKPKSNFQRFNSQLNMSGMPFDQLQSENVGSSSKYHHNRDMPQQQRISINIPFGQDEEKKGGSSSLSKIDKKKKSLKKQPSKFAETKYNDEDYESYKPKTLASRRRQQSEQDVLNTIFADVIDKCIIFDKMKVFHYPVKRKDAPNYYDVIKNPIDLTAMKNKAKRGEYVSKEEFMKEIELLKTNAEFYNGAHSPIGQQARELEQHAVEKLSEVENDIINLEMLVREKNEQISSASKIIN